MKAIVDYPYARTSLLYFDLMGEMTLAETRIVGTVIRLTVGWDKEYEAISYSDFMKHTKLTSRTTVSNAIKSAIKKGYIATHEKVDARGKKRYTLGATLRQKPEKVSSTSTTSVPETDGKEVVSSTTNRTSTSTMNVPDEPLTSTVNVPHTKKEVLKEKDKEIIPASGTEKIFLLPANVPSSIQQSEDDMQLPPNPEETAIDFSKKPYTQAEYEWFVVSGRCNKKKLSESVFCPVWHNYIVERKDGTKIPFVLNTIWDDRQSLLRNQIKQDANSWNMTVDLIKHFWDVEAGHARRMATMFLGTAKSGEWKKYKFEQPMSPEELYAFGLWIFDMRCVEKPYKPRSAEDIAEFAQEFRELTNHFEHVNYASYKIREFFAEPVITTKPDYDDYTPPPEQQSKFLQDLESQYDLGFSLSGDF